MLVVVDDNDNDNDDAEDFVACDDIFVDGRGFRDVGFDDGFFKLDSDEDGDGDGDGDGDDEEVELRSRSMILNAGTLHHFKYSTSVTKSRQLENVGPPSITLPSSSRTYMQNKVICP